MEADEIAQFYLPFGLTDDEGDHTSVLSSDFSSAWCTPALEGRRAVPVMLDLGAMPVVPPSVVQAWNGPVDAMKQYPGSTADSLTDGEGRQEPECASRSPLNPATTRTGNAAASSIPRVGNRYGRGAGQLGASSKLMNAPRQNFTLVGEEESSSVSCSPRVSTGKVRGGALSGSPVKAENGDESAWTGNGVSHAGKNSVAAGGNRPRPKKMRPRRHGNANRDEMGGASENSFDVDVGRFGAVAGGRSAAPAHQHAHGSDGRDAVQAAQDTTNRMHRRRVSADDRDSSSDLVALAASRVDEHRQEWARKLANAVETFGRTFERNAPHFKRTRPKDGGAADATSTSTKKSVECKDGARTDGKACSPYGYDATAHDGADMSSYMKERLCNDTEDDGDPHNSDVIVHEADEACKGSKSYEPSWMFNDYVGKFTTGTTPIVRTALLWFSVVLDAFIGVSFSLLGWHVLILSTLLSDVRLLFCYAFMYLFPLVMLGVASGGLPYWATGALWYLFLVQFFFSRESSGIVAFVQVVLPLALHARSGAAEDLLAKMSGGERLLAAYVLASIRKGRLYRSVACLSVSLQLCLALLFGDSRVCHWIMLLLGVTTVYPLAELRRRFVSLESAAVTYGVSYLIGHLWRKPLALYARRP